MGGAMSIFTPPAPPIADGLLRSRQMGLSEAKGESDALFLCIISLFLPYLGGSCPRNFFLVVAPTLRACGTRTK